MANHIVDQFGHPMEVTELTTELALETLGATGLRQTGGFIVEEWMQRLLGVQGVRVYREMKDNNAVIGAILLLIEQMIKQAEWRVEPAGVDQPSQEAAEFLEGAIDDMAHTWEDLISEVLSMLPFGWAYFEVVYKIRQGNDPPASEKGERPAKSKFDDGKLGWRKISIRAQDTLLRWQLDDDGGIRGMHQTSLLSGTSTLQPSFIPIEKAILFRTTAHKNNPEGRSMLRNAVRSFFFLRRMQEIEAIGIERDLAGYPVFEVPLEVISKQASATSIALRQMAFDTVRQIRRDEREGAVVPTELDPEGKPTGFKLKLLNSGGKRQIITNDVIRRYETRIAMSLLADFVMLGLDKVGVQSLASSKTHVFAKAIGGLMDNIEQTFKRFGSDRLMELNGFARETWPTVVHGDIETPPLDEIGGYVTALTTAGISLTDEATQRKLREIGTLPEPDADVAKAFAGLGVVDGGRRK